MNALIVYDSKFGNTERIARAIGGRLGTGRLIRAEEASVLGRPECDLLVAPYGVVQWVRNLRAAGTAILTRGRRSETIAVSALPARTAAPVLKQYLLYGAWVGAYFDVTKNSPLAAFELEVVRHLVFQITTIEHLFDRRNSDHLVG